MKTEFFGNDGEATIVGIGSERTGFMLSYGFSFTDEHVALIEKYKCKSLTFKVIESSGEINSFDSIVELNLHFGDKNCLVSFPKIHKSIKSLTLTGEVPTTNNYLKIYPSLKEFEIDYSSNLLHVFCQNKIIDLKINNLKSNNLNLLSEFKKLKRLQLIGGRLDALEGLEELQSLETLMVDGIKKLVSVDAILRSPTLANISFHNFRTITDWELLAQMKQLENLSFDTIDSIGFIEKLPNLEFIFCKKVLDGDLSPVSSHTNIAKSDIVNSTKKLPFYDAVS